MLYGTHMYNFKGRETREHIAPVQALTWPAQPAGLSGDATYVPAIAVTAVGSHAGWYPPACASPKP